MRFTTDIYKADCSFSVNTITVFHWLLGKQISFVSRSADLFSFIFGRCRGSHIQSIPCFLSRVRVTDRHTS